MKYYVPYLLSNSFFLYFITAEQILIERKVKETPAWWHDHQTVVSIVVISSTHEKGLTKQTRKVMWQRREERKRGESGLGDNNYDDYDDEVGT